MPVWPDPETRATYSPLSTPGQGVEDLGGLLAADRFLE